MSPEDENLDANLDVYKQEPKDPQFRRIGPRRVFRTQEELARWRTQLAVGKAIGLVSSYPEEMTPEILKWELRGDMLSVEFLPEEISSRLSEIERYKVERGHVNPEYEAQVLKGVDMLRRAYGLEGEK